MIGLASWGQTDTLVWDSPLLSVGGGEGEKDKCLSTMINSSHSHATARRHPAHCAWDIGQLRLVQINMLGQQSVQGGATYKSLYQSSAHRPRLPKGQAVRTYVILAVGVKVKPST